MTAVFVFSALTLGWLAQAHVHYWRGRERGMSAFLRALLPFRLER
jgi:hypothetical protein